MSELPSGWVRAPIGAVLHIQYGQGLPERARDQRGHVPVYGSAGVVGRHTASLVEDPALVIGRKGGVGSTYLSRGPSWPIDTTYYARIPSGVHGDYLAYQMEALGLKRLDSSTAIPSLRREDLEASQLAIAPTGEQERIVAAIEEQFSRLDAGVAALERARQNLKSFQLAVLRYMRAGPWDLVPMGDLVKNHDGKRVPVKAALRKPGPYPYYGAQGVIDHVDGYLFDGDYVLVAEDGANLTSRVLPIAIEAHGKFWVNNHAHVVKPKEGVLAEYLVAVLNADPLDGAITGTAQPKLPQKALNRLEIPVPSLSEQQSLVDYLREAELGAQSAPGAIGRAARRAGRLRSAILAAAFSGQLVPQDTNDEPASVLLERIAADLESSSGAQTRRRRVRKGVAA